MKLTLNNVEDVYKSKKCSIGTMELKGYELIDDLFVDKSGMGADNKPALTTDQFIKQVEKAVVLNGTIYSTITNEGQFQLYIGLFKKSGKYKLRKLENNTYEYNDNEGLKVRLHDTDILSFVGDNVTLSTGGYYTNTTKARLNKYLPMGFSIYQKDFQWYIKAYDKTITFKDNITLDINTGLVIG